MVRQSHIAAILTALIALPLAHCSDTADSGTGSAGNGNSQTCSGGFCIEDDVRIGVSPAQLLFTDLPVGQSSDRELTISHAGTSGTLKVDAATFAPETEEFQVVEWKALSLGKGGKAKVIVRYTPKSAGAKSLNLVLANNDTDNTKRQFKVPVKVAAAAAQLTVNPNPVEFGNIAAGATPTKELTLLNTGTLDLLLTSVQLAKNESPDFVIDALPDLTKAIPPGSSVKMSVKYSPKGGDSDLSHLLFESSDGRKYQVEVQGNEIAPRISVVPPKVNLGAIELGQEVKADIKVCNVGFAELKVAKMEVSPVSLIKDVKLSVAAPLNIAAPKQAGLCETGVTMVLTLKADKAVPKNGSPVASIVFSSNDPVNPTLTLPIFAETNSPKLLVTPDDYVDFSLVGKGVKVTRKIELFNEGSAPLDVTKLAITDEKDKLSEFSILPGAFGPSAANPQPETLAPGQYAVFQVQFEAKGPPDQKAQANLHIYSTDPGTPDKVLPMYAERKEGVVCNVQLVPPILNFGLLPYGATKTIPIGFKNTGSGVCVFKSVNVLACGGNGLPPPLGPGPMKCKQSGSPQFYAGAPSTALFKLAPGDTGKMLVTFTAPDDLGFLLGKPNEVTPFGALLVASFEDSSTGQVKTFPNVALTDPAKVAATPPNLEAKVGKAQVSVLPGQLDFGVVSVGCKSPGKEISVFNTGTTEAYINKLELQGCGLEVQPLGWPGIPKTGYPISQAKPATFKVQYGPQNVGKDQCQLLVWTNLSGTCMKNDGTQTGKDCSVNGDCGAGEFCGGQLFTVPINGEGTLETEFTDEFVQGVGKQVDVLFIVDNSGSMSEEQDNLAKNFGTFTQIADLWQNNYHIGVVTTDMDDAKQSGKLIEKSGVRVVTPKTVNGPQILLSMVKQGTNGSGDEQGLSAAEAALTLPNVYDSGKKCAADADCKSDGGFCVPDAEDPATKKCGGTNRTFVRKNAGLEVVVLSDEEDGSAADINYYTNFLFSIKGFANKGLFHLHAIVGDAGNGCKGSGGDAVAGDRYLAVAKATGGKIGSICSTSFAQVLKDIGNVAFGLAQQFFLTRTPEESTIVVKVKGQVCTKGNFQYDAASNSVIFPQGSPCMPAKGDTVSIYYKMLCFP